MHSDSPKPFSKIQLPCPTYASSQTPSCLGIEEENKALGITAEAIKQFSSRLQYQKNVQTKILCSLGEFETTDGEDCKE